MIPAQAPATLADIQHKITLQDIQTWLDAGQLETQVSTGNRTTPARWWKVRRNGLTQHRLRSTPAWRIPIKAGFREYGYIEPGNLALYRLTTDAEYPLASCAPESE